MWFLTNDGIDRFNGKEFKHYKLKDDGEEINSMLNLNWIYTDKHNNLWEIGKKGRIFCYDLVHDEFDLVFKLPNEAVKESSSLISYSFIDQNDNIWLCCDKVTYLYNIATKKLTQIKNELQETITSVQQIDSTHFFIGTETCVHHSELKDGTLNWLPCKELDNVSIQINELYYHPATKKLFIGTSQRGVYVYDTQTKKTSQAELNLTDISISCIVPLNNKELLIATDGAGVFKLNANTGESIPYITADYNRYNGMNGNNINDIFIDEEQRIWMANYPLGITVRNNRYADYNWIKHSISNKQSLINNQVNAILEDQEGDLWYATNNGISLYLSKSKQWHSLLSSDDTTKKNRNSIFTTLCEISPGIVWVGGYNAGIYQINKRSLSAVYFTPSEFAHVTIRPDKYIRTIIKDSEGYIWLGGYHHLKRLNLQSKTLERYDGLNSITTIIEKDKKQMWIGSANGLFCLDKQLGSYQQIKLPIESTYIYSLYQTESGLLYIGTGGSGLLVFDPKRGHFTHYHTLNSTLISSSIYTILPDGNGDIMISTEEGLTSFYPQTEAFHNWTKDKGLLTTHFNPNSGVLRKNNNFILGSTDGAVEFNKEMQLPRTYSTQMIFDDFKVFYQTVYPGDPGSPLKELIDSTNVLRLKYNQNIFSFQVSSINYDCPSDILYSWKLEGFYDEWSRPDNESTIRFTNLSPGAYTLRVRAVSREDMRIVLEERSMEIIVANPIWLSSWAIALYILLIGLIGTAVLRMLKLKRERKVSDEKIHFFVNTAHDIRTPLTLIKAPLEELRDREQLSNDGSTNIDTALRNVNALLRLTTNLINFERTNLYSSELYISEYELKTFTMEAFDSFRSYANGKHINYTYQAECCYLNVWFDKEKMDSILRNILSNALKYTPDEGSVTVSISESSDSWSVEIKDTGIGIPASEQKKLFRSHFRASNTINSQVTGSGIGLMLVARLVELHKGKVLVNSVEHQGTTIKITFPKGNKHFAKEHINTSNTEVAMQMESVVVASNTYENTKKKYDQTQQRVLVVEDNEELSNYLNHILSERYNVQICNNGKEALAVVKEYKPELIISDIMMPQMRGDELCTIIKNDIETSHIPVILLTALNDEKNILAGLQSGADEYVVKPFNIGILKATVANILSNRALLRNKYANLELDDADDDCINCSTDIDWKFIATVKKSVEENMNTPSFNVDTLCALLNMSRTSFYNKLKALTDQAPADYIRLIRLNRAAQLLRENKYSVTEIADKTGFNDAKYFREVFKKHFKVSPSKYGKGEEAK